MIGTTSVAFFGKPLPEVVKLTTNLDVDFLEFICEYPHCYPPEISKEERREILKAKENLEFSVHSIFTDINIVHINPGLKKECIRQTEECIKFAQDIEAKYVVIHPGEIPRIARNLPKKILENFGVQDLKKTFHFLSKQSLLELKEFSKEMDLDLCIENLCNKYELCTSSEEHLYLLDEFYACFDTGHANVCKNLFNHAKAIENKVRYVHIHDNHGKTDEHLALGDGNIDYKKVLEILGDKWYSFEPRASDIEAVKKSIQILKDIT